MNFFFVKEDFFPLIFFYQLKENLTIIIQIISLKFILNFYIYMYDK